MVDNRCVFERKTLLDFAASIMDGRLFSQAHKLARATVPAAIILEGRASDLTACRVSREALQGAMVSLSLIFRLPVLRSMEAGETAKLLLYTSQQIWRHEQDYAFRAGRRPKNRRRRQLRILQGLPGVGPDRAVRLLDAFGSVEAVMTADPDCLAGVEGIGTKTASAIRQVLSESPVPYGVNLPRIADL
jgi:ERCC4-type nuclease